MEFIKDTLGWIAILAGYAYTIMGDFIVGNHQYFVPVCSSLGALSFMYYNFARVRSLKKGGDDDN